MIVITVARKPLGEGTVAKNAMVYGTGGVNIDACRITSDGGHFRGIVKGTGGNNQQTVFSGRPLSSVGFQATNHVGGRWPANLILSHLAGCQNLGTKQVKPTSVNGVGPVRRTGTHSEAGGHQTIGRQQPPVKGYAGEDGKETVAAWKCAYGCPVAALNEQSGESKSSKGIMQFKRAESTSWKERGGSFTPGREWEAEGYGDTGGASRFFKVVSGGETQQDG